MASPDKVNLGRLAYTVYEHPDLTKYLQFAEDFGFEIPDKAEDGNVYLRGYGIDPYLCIARECAPGEPRKFGGSGWVARTEEDFERACKMEGAEVVDISKRPGGGKMVRIPDNNGFPFEVLWGQEERPAPERGVSRVYDGQPNVNTAIEKPRKGQFNRMRTGPSMIHKLGHFGYGTDNHRKTCDWYSDHFNFKATDILHKPGDPSAELLAFYHLDLGREYSDHHCLLIATHHGPQTGTDVHHSSYEVEDFDTQMMGHQWLGEKGYKQMWGVGRHVMGSQIFDYWFDTSGFVMEHYTDSDVVNEDTPTHRQDDTPGAIWGPPLPTAKFE